MNRSQKALVVAILSAPVLHGCSAPRLGGRQTQMTGQYAKIVVVCQDPSNRLVKYGVDTLGIEDWLAGSLNDRGFTVIDRGNLEKVLEQQYINRSGMTEANARQVGRLLNADAILLATVGETRVSQAAMPKILSYFGQAAGSLLGNDEPVDVAPQYEARVRISARLIEVASGRVKWGGVGEGSVLVYSDDDLNGADVMAAGDLAAGFGRYKGRSAPTPIDPPSPE